MSKTARQVKVDTTPTKDAVVSSLTRDASIEACIFDLIDNSIDAARESIFAKGRPDVDQYGLPTSYAGFKIDVRISGKGIIVEDNCGGIDGKFFQKGALKFGKRSRHKLGIGAFGVGLNRAVFRLGKKANITTDNGSERLSLTIDAKIYLKEEDNWGLDAWAIQSSGQVGTSVEITPPVPDVEKTISDSNWQKEFGQQISERYFSLLQKGIVIEYNGQILSPIYVPIRDGGPYDSRSKHYKSAGGINVYLLAGQHIRHRFSAEPDFDLPTNRQISDDFGWSIICNDRLIVRSDKSPKTGWDHQWHPEFNGFVGYVRFVSETPDLLPWNTTKSDVDLTNAVYRDALDDMREFVRAWRSDAYHAKKTKQGNGILIPTPPGTPPLPPPLIDPRGALPNRQKPGPVKRPKPTKKIGHNTFTTILPDDVDEKLCHDKLLALVHEAKLLDLSTTAYAGMGLLRTLFETASILFLTRHKRYDDLKSFSFDLLEQKNGVAPSEKQKKGFIPRLEDILLFLAQNKDIWGSDKANYMARCVTNFAANKPKLNDSVHHPYMTINRQEALAIRDASLPVLRHMIEN